MFILFVYFLINLILFLYYSVLIIITDKATLSVFPISVFLQCVNSNTQMRSFGLAQMNLYNFSYLNFHFGKTRLVVLQWEKRIV